MSAEPAQSRRRWLAFVAGLPAAVTAVATAAPAAGPAAPAPDSGSGRTQHVVALGDSSVTLHVQSRGSHGLTFISVHEDEATAVQAVERLLRQPQQAGRLVALRQQGRRLIDFSLAGQAFRFDPNRIFTERGLPATLQKHGANSAAARAAVGVLRDALVALLPSDAEGPIVAVHNNTRGGFSVAHYAAGGLRAGDAAAVRRAQPGAGWTDDDFFLVTERSLFDALAAERVNVVLQSASAEDDGSLSILAQREGRRYINVEARHGHADAQQRMLTSVLRLFAPRR